MKYEPGLTRCAVLTLAAMLMLTAHGVAQTAHPLLKRSDSLLASNWQTKDSDSLHRLRTDAIDMVAKINEILRQEATTPTLDRTVLLLLIENRNKLNYRVDKTGPKPARQPTEQEVTDGRCQNCIEVISYFLRSPSIKPGEVDQQTQQRFLQYLNECFGYFAQSPKYYSQAVEMFHGLVFDEQAATQELVERSHKDPAKLASFLEQLKAKTESERQAWEHIQNILQGFAKAGVDLNQLLEFLEQTFTGRSGEEVKLVMEHLNEALGHTATANRSAELLAYTLPGSLDVKQFLNPLLQYIKKVQDEVELRRVFARLRDLAAETGATPGALAIEQLFQKKEDASVPRQVLENMVQAAKRLADIDNTEIVVHQARRFGPPVSSDSVDYLEQITPSVVQGWRAAAIDDQPDSLQFESLFDQRTGGQLRHWPGLNVSKQTLHIYTRYSVSKRRLHLSFRMVDGQDGFMLGSFEQTVSIPASLEEFKAALLQATLTTKEAFENSLSGYRRFERLLNEKTIHFYSFDRFKAFQLFDAQVAVRRHERPGSGRWLFADGIVIPKQFMQGDASQAFAGFRETLVRTLQQREALLGLPVRYAEQPSRNSLTLDAKATKADSTKPARLDVVVRSQSLPVLTLELVFSSQKSGTQQATRNEYFAKYVAESVQALLGLNTIYPEPQSIARWYSVPSLLFAGTSQLTIADKLRPESIKSQKRLGWLFAATEAAMLGAAFAFDRKAINGIDDGALAWRNRFLAGALATAVTSALASWIRIGKHNNKVRKYIPFEGTN